MNTKYNVDENYRVEILRKLVNLSSVVIPLTYISITKILALQILIPLTVVSIVIDVLRHYHQSTSRIFHKIFGFLLRKHECDVLKKKLTGHTWFMITATICIGIFPKYIAVISLIIFSFSDIISALIGRRFGSKRFRNRSLEGSTAFVIVAFIVVVLAPKIEYKLGEYFICACASLVGAVAEILSYGIIDDNFAIPISISLTMYLLYSVIYPDMDLINFVFY